MNWQRLDLAADTTHDRGDTVVIVTLGAMVTFALLLLAALTVVRRTRQTGTAAGAASRFASIWPFLWIIFIPLVTVPLHSAVLRRLVSGNPHCVHRPGEVYMFVPYECPTGDVLPAILPGLLNLGAFLWVLSPHKRVRVAALVAGSLGALGLLVPLLGVWRADTVEVGIFLVWNIEHWSMALGVALWVLSVIVTVVLVLAAWVGADQQDKGIAPPRELPRPRP